MLLFVEFSKWLWRDRQLIIIVNIVIATGRVDQELPILFLKKVMATKIELKSFFR